MFQLSCAPASGIGAARSRMNNLARTGLLGARIRTVQLMLACNVRVHWRTWVRAHQRVSLLLIFIFSCHFESLPCWLATRRDLNLLNSKRSKIIGAVKPKKGCVPKFFEHIRFRKQPQKLFVKFFCEFGCGTREDLNPVF